jgi:hypothetical protein
MSSILKQTIDLFGKPLIIDNLDKAIEQTEMLLEFSQENEISYSEVVKQQEIKYSGLQYYSDLLKKLTNIKENEHELFT